jgi:predicted kinase
VYSPEESGIVYHTCYATVRQLLQERHAVIFDGTNGRRSGRRLFAAIARSEHAEHVSVLVHASADVVRSRITSRAAGLSPSFGSDAGINVFERMALTENYGGHFDLVVDAGADIGPSVRLLAEVIAGQRSIDGGGLQR